MIYIPSVNEKERGNEMATPREIKILIEQIGSPAFFMMGAKNLGFSTDDKGRPTLSWKVGRNAKSVTHVSIALNADDTYSVEFIRVNMRAKEMRKVISEALRIYVDMLHASIEHGTGLALSL